MRVIQPNCREHLTAEDASFLSSVLAESKHENEFLASLLCDPAARDRILDCPTLISAIQDSPELLKISSFLYFYILVRHCLLSHDLNDRLLADYVAEMLAEFADRRRMVTPLANTDRSYEYLIDLRQSAAASDGATSFAIHCHTGNYSLFCSGLFPGRISARQKTKAAPGIDYFESMGISGFHAASLLHLAAEFELKKLLEELASEFHTVRLALNTMSDRYLFTPAA